MGEIRTQGSEINPAKPHAEVLQENIRHTEAEISDTLHQIEARFKPSYLKREAKERLRHYSLVGLIKTIDAVKARPVPIALGTGAAIYLLRKLSRRRSLSHAAERGGAYVEAVPKELRKNPVKTLRRYISLGRMAVIFASAVTTVLMREKGRRASPPRQYPGEVAVRSPSGGTYYPG